jgi:hypothetical protein
MFERIKKNISDKAIEHAITATAGIALVTGIYGIIWYVEINERISEIKELIRHKRKR